MTENSDALWDDGVAPELALDFDAPNVSTSEATWTFVGAFGAFAVLWTGIALWTKGARDDNPAFSHATDVYEKDYSNHALTPVALDDDDESVEDE